MIYIFCIFFAARLWIMVSGSSFSGKVIKIPQTMQGRTAASPQVLPTISEPQLALRLSKSWNGKSVASTEKTMDYCKGSSQIANRGLTCTTLRWSSWAEREKRIVYSKFVFTDLTVKIDFYVEVLKYLRDCGRSLRLEL